MTSNQKFIDKKGSTPAHSGMITRQRGIILEEPSFHKETQEFIENALTLSLESRDFFAGQKEETNRNAIWIKWHFAGLGADRIVALMEQPKVSPRMVLYVVNRFLNRIPPDMKKKYQVLRFDNQAELRI